MKLFLLPSGSTIRLALFSRSEPDGLSFIDRICFRLDADGAFPYNPADMVKFLYF
jgi:hypothetical protein